MIAKGIPFRTQWLALCQWPGSWPPLAPRDSPSRGCIAQCNGKSRRECWKKSLRNPRYMNCKKVVNDSEVWPCQRSECTAVWCWINNPRFAPYCSMTSNRLAWSRERALRQWESTDGQFLSGAAKINTILMTWNNQRIKEYQINQSINDSNHQSNNQWINQSVDWGIWINKSLGLIQSINQSINRPIVGHSLINQSVIFKIIKEIKSN